VANGNFGGVYRRGPELECMAAGCHRKALYRHAKTKTGRGYCSEHKALAVTASQTNRASAKHEAIALAADSNGINDWELRTDRSNLRHEERPHPWAYQWMKRPDA
jgi:hypothetical protein